MFAKGFYIGSMASWAYKQRVMYRNRMFSALALWLAMAGMIVNVLSIINMTDFLGLGYYTAASSVLGSVRTDVIEGLPSGVWALLALGATALAGLGLRISETADHLKPKDGLLLMGLSGLASFALNIGFYTGPILLVGAFALQWMSMVRISKVSVPDVSTSSTER
jgi:hypothetical protein